FESAFDNEGLVAYYTQWLPDWLEQVDPGMSPTDRIGCLRTVQAVGWGRPGGMSGVVGALRWAGMGSSGTKRIDEGDGGRALLPRIHDEQSRRLSVYLLEELPDLTEKDIRTWSLELPAETDRDSLVRSLSGRDLDTAAIFERAALALGGPRSLDYDEA